MLLTVVPMRRNSPLTGWPSISSAIFWVKSPSATALMTRATSVVGCTRSPMSALTEPTLAAQPPFISLSATRSVIRPSRPTTRSTRTISLASASFRPTIALNSAAMARITAGLAA